LARKDGVVEIAGQKPQLFIKGLLHLSGCVGNRAGCATGRWSLRRFAQSGFFAAARMGLEIGNSVVGSRERTVYATLPDVLQPFGDAAVDHPALCGRVFIV